MAAFKKAIDAKCDMIELDVRLSSDNLPVVFHDKRLQRTSSSTGALHKKHSKQLTSIDNGSWFSPKFHREKIPLLSDVLSLVKKGVTLNIEIKPDVVSTSEQSTVEIVVNHIHKTKADSKILCTSFNHRLIRELHEVDNSITSGVIYHPLSHFRRSPSTLVKSAHAEIFVCSKMQITRDVVSDTHSEGFKLFVYGVKTGRDVQRMLELEVDGIICNNPRFVRETIELLLK